MPYSDSNSSKTASQPPSSGCVAAIVLAAGRGQRFGSAENKVLLPLAGIPIWIRAVQAMRSCPSIGKIVLVVRVCDRVELLHQATELRVDLVDGGPERDDSVRAGLDWLTKIADPSPYIAVHDAARPLVTLPDIDAVIRAATARQAAILATPVRGTIKRGRDDFSPIATVDRRELWEALTPQVFAAAILHQAYQRHRGRPATDDAELVERSGTPVCLVPGSAENLKITRSEDLQIAAAILLQRLSKQT